MSNRRWLARLGAVIFLGPWLLALDEHSFSDNQAMLTSMSPERLEQLLRKRDKFEMLPLEEQDKLRGIDRELHQEPNAEALMQTLRGYHELLKTLRSSEQAELKDLEPEARISEIKQLISSRRERDIGLTNQTRLSAQDNDALRQWAGEFAQRKQADIAKLFPSGERGLPPGQRRGNQPQVARLVFSAIRGTISDDKLDAIVSTEDIAQLEASLSPKANDSLAAQKSKLEKIRLVFRWIYASFMPRISEEELRQFSVEALDDNQREIIYRLGPEEGRQELIRLYRESRQWRPPQRSPENERGRFSDEPPRGRPNFD